MRRVFADTAYFVALLSPRDSLHGRAMELARGLGDAQMVTSQMVLTEVLNFFSGAGPQLRSHAFRLVVALSSAPDVLVVSQTARLFREAAMLYGNREDKCWSVTDCSSMLLMEDMEITEVLTADHHFEQAGFVVLMS